MDAQPPISAAAEPHVALIAPMGKPRSLEEMVGALQSGLSATKKDNKDKRTRENSVDDERAEANKTASKPTKPHKAVCRGDKHKKTHVANKTIEAKRTAVLQARAAGKIALGCSRCRWGPKGCDSCPAQKGKTKKE